MIGCEESVRFKTPNFVTTKKISFMIIPLNFACLIFFVLCSMQLFYVSVIINSHCNVNHLTGFNQFN